MADEPAPFREKTRQLAAWFLGPKAENAPLVEELALHILRDYFHWRRNYFPSDEILITQHMRRESLDYADALFQQLNEMLARLKRHFPFYNPRYIAHMLSDQTIPALLGYFAGMLYNPNNVTPEAAPVTVAWEFEVAAQVLRMLGYRPPPPREAHHRERRKEFGWAHITSGGTIATLEALWVARNVRYFPLAAREAARLAGLSAVIKPAGRNRGEVVPLADADTRVLLGVKPNEAVFLWGRLLEAARRKWSEGGKLQSAAETLRRMNGLLRETGLYCGSGGVARCYQECPPALFAAGTAHYSVTKAADVLGAGRDQVILVDIDRQFRMEVRDLEEKIRWTIRQGLLPLAVVPIAGTTEEGAVDPIHRIVELRKRLEQECGASFWIHVDAAWGGYLRSLFVSASSAAPGVLPQAQQDECIEQINTFTRRPLTLTRGNYCRSIQLQWGSREVCYAFLSLPEAESATVDPHKMGYVPYPCGLVAFRNDRVRTFVMQEAPYIHENTQDESELCDHRPPVSLGPYILEGSKPGAAAAACWLAHRMIPPHREGFGEIIRASLSAARELYERLVHWEAACRANHQQTAYQFLTLTPTPPDTNMLCFIAKEKSNSSLARANELNRCIYSRFTISQERSEREYSYSQPFFLSRTTLRPPQYSPHALEDFFRRAGLEAGDYETQGLFVLRSTLMNPYLVLAAETGHRQQLLAEFVEILAEITNQTIEELRNRSHDSGEV